MIRNLVLGIFLVVSCTSCGAVDARDAAVERAHRLSPAGLDRWLAAPYFVVTVYPGNGELLDRGILPGPTSGVGFAIPVAPDGYFLVPAHALAGDYPACIFGRWGANPRGLRARVVFRADREEGKDDFAILHVEAGVHQVPSFSTGTPNEGDVVYALVRKGQEAVFAQGRVVSVSGFEGESHRRVLKTDIPVVLGDSGGPVVSPDGRLIGLTSSVTHLGWYHRMYAVAPRAELIGSILEKDRLSRTDK